ncbi:MAG: hypothetical protein NTX61_11190 [Bacteroidetes bacterium]|nr:hypothetical protein [Bacteroidota bacterium]
MRTCIYTVSLIIVMLAGGWSCKKKEVAKGDVQVLVQYQTLPEFPNGAEIYSDPPGIDGITDGSASILIRNVPTGTYQVYCYKNGYGGGKSAVSILANQLTAVLIILIPGYDPGGAPIIDEVSPADHSQFSPSDSISFQIRVHDAKTPANNISVKAESNIDGVIFQGYPSDSGVATFRKKLSRNSHIIAFTATNPRNFSAHTYVTLDVTQPDKIHLNTPVLINHTVQMNWTKYTGSDFDHYEVYTYEWGGNPNLLASFTNASTLTYTDTNPLMTDTAYYYVSVVDKNGKSSQSNVQAVGRPSGFLFYMDIWSVCIDPTGTWFYTADDYHIIKINYVTGAIERSWNYPYGSINGIRVKMEVADNGLGKELYVCFSSLNAYILDAATLSMKVDIQSPNSYPNGYIDMSTNGDGYIYLAPVWDWNSQWGKMFSYKRSTRQFVDSIQYPNYASLAAMHCVPGKNEAITIDANLFMHIYHDATGHFSSIQKVILPATLMGWQLFPFDFPSNGNFFLTGTETRVYASDVSETYKGLFNSDGLTSGACADNNNNIYVAYRYENNLRKATYPSTSGSAYYHSKGYPTYVMNDGTNLVILSRIEWTGNTYMVEVVPMK